MAVRGREDYYRFRKPRNCDVCQSEFMPESGAHRFCSPACRGKWKYITGLGNTENQYKRISGNWYKYALRLRRCTGVKMSRQGLTVEAILNALARQNYRCALSGRELTCQLEKGTVFHTNASIDRIEAGGPYTEDNIQMVCRAVNCFRTNKSIADFVGWCRDVANHYERTKLEARVRDVSRKTRGEETPGATQRCPSQDDSSR